LRLVLVGDGSARESLLQAARTAGISERVVLPGFSARPWEAYPGLDVFLLPTHDEALSLALIEAMACGCCAVAMGVGGVPEVLAGPEVGWLVPPGDRAGFMDAMDAAVRLDGDARAVMGHAARAHVLEKFDAGRQYAALADLLENGEHEGKVDASARGLVTCN
jgi:glycosyltransferase involved in cell wall biosynthesis